MISKYQCPRLKPKRIGFYRTGNYLVFGYGYRAQCCVKCIGIPLKRYSSRKVIGIGLGKTGTTSLAHALV